MQQQLTRREGERERERNRLTLQEFGPNPVVKARDGSEDLLCQELATCSALFFASSLSPILSLSLSLSLSFSFSVSLSVHSQVQASVSHSSYNLAFLSSVNRVFPLNLILLSSLLKWHVISESEREAEARDSLGK